MYPIRSSYRYLKKLHRYNYLRRGRDFQGRIVYSLSPRGARWLLRDLKNKDVKAAPLYTLFSK